MHFRGGGIGHRHMRQVEPTLDRTGWGNNWPCLNHREPEPKPIIQSTSTIVDSEQYINRDVDVFDGLDSNDSDDEEDMEDDDAEDLEEIEEED
jgi:hypothetical protein